MRPTSFRLLAAAGAAFLLPLASAGTRAEEPVPSGTATAYAPATAPDTARPSATIEAEKALKGAELDKLRQDMQLSTERQAEIAAEIAALDKDAASLNEALLKAVGGVQDLEQSITDSEARLADSAARERDIRTSLEDRREVLADVLAAAQRIGRRPPPALVVKPEDALGAVRSAILLGAVLPEVRVQAEALADDLTALVDVRKEAEAERDRLKEDAKRYAVEQRRLTLLMVEKKRGSEQKAGVLAEERARATELANQAKSLQELMASLDRKLASARKAEVAAAAAAQAERPRAGDAARLSPAIAFTAAKGLLPLPVRGVPIQSFGEDNGLGGISDGLSIATRAGARVTAPADGWVAYAGPFRSYGQLLILNVGDGYHVVLAGMERIDVELGQFVLTGEPVGAMGSQRLASATAPGASLSQPVLYIEFRKDGASIDPTPWWVASQDRKVRG